MCLHTSITCHICVLLTCFGSCWHALVAADMTHNNTGMRTHIRHIILVWGHIYWDTAPQQVYLVCMCPHTSITCRICELLTCFTCCWHALLPADMLYYLLTCFSTCWHASLPADMLYSRIWHTPLALISERYTVPQRVEACNEERI
jgi:hypothetical protein